MLKILQLASFKLEFLAPYDRSINQRREKQKTRWWKTKTN